MCSCFGFSVACHVCFLLFEGEKESGVLYAAAEAWTGGVSGGGPLTFLPKGPLLFHIFLMFRVATLVLIH